MRLRLGQNHGDFVGKEHEPALRVESSTSLKTSHQERLLKIRILGLNPELGIPGKSPGKLSI